MFTGLIQAQGRVLDMSRTADDAVWTFKIETPWPADDILTGASIAHDGCCLTVVEHGDNWHTVDVSRETLSKTTLKSWKKSTPINLERSLRAGDELGGHFVTGHVDAVSQLLASDTVDGCLDLMFSMPHDLAPMIAQKGSVTLNGVSLTVNAVGDETFKIMIIPHTADVTNLGALSVGEQVNLEVDILARYLFRQRSVLDG